MLLVRHNPINWGLPSTVDDEGVSIVSLSDEDGSDKGDAGTSTDVGVLPPSQK